MSFSIFSFEIVSFIKTFIFSCKGFGCCIDLSRSGVISATPQTSIPLQEIDSYFIWSIIFVSFHNQKKKRPKKINRIIVLRAELCMCQWWQILMFPLSGLFIIVSTGCAQQVCAGPEPRSATRAWVVHTGTDTKRAGNPNRRSDSSARNTFTLGASTNQKSNKKTQPKFDDFIFHF